MSNSINMPALTDVKQWEKIFSNQKFNSYLWREHNSRSYEECLLDMLTAHSQLPFPKDQFKGSREHTLDEMASATVALDFLCFLIKLLKPQVIFEIGSFVGYSTANFAGVCGKNCQIFSIEKFETFADVTRQNLKNLAVDTNVTVLTGDAKEVLANLDLGGLKVDLAFVDGNKEHYLFYLKWFLRNLSDNGMVVVDDIFFHGDVLNQHCSTPKGKGAREVLDYLSQSESIDYALIPFSNGLTLIRKST